MFVIPSTKQIASRMLDLPEPLRPVMALNDGSQSLIWVLTGYDLKPKVNSRSQREVGIHELRRGRAVDNQLLDPHGGSRQDAFGRSLITCCRHLRN